MHPSRPRLSIAATRASAFTFCAALLLSCAGCGGNATQTRSLRLGGAQIPLEFVQGWLERSREPAFNVSRAEPVYLSQNGFRALARGDCDIACTDRPLVASELEQFGENPPIGRRVGFYGYALYVNDANRIDSIFSGHIELLFKRRILDWGELGGDAGAITLLGPGKGTRGGALLARQAGVWFSEPTWIALESDAAVIQRVREDPLALGFAGVGLDGDGVRYLGLRMERRGEPVFPSIEAIEQDRYGLAKVIYVYWREPASVAVNTAVSYLFSEAGQAALQRTDIWPIPADRSAVEPPAPLE
ncbi:MAG: hypothetical protein HRU75_00760 [Planctomycetia bacterium]|nr:MAG: hypothetical protein HRU75_00760 [Planctomycetia bacterium]